MRRLKILFVATKPPWPPVDGGRLLVRDTVDELARQGHRVTLVAPAGGASAAADAPPGVDALLVPARPRSLLTSLVLAQLRGGAATLVRHSSAPVRAEVARLLDAGGWDVVHAEQLQALAQAAPAFERGVPVVFRAQNVESDLWAATAAALGTARGLLARREARRLARAEGAAVARAGATVALTAEDAGRLAELAGARGRTRVVRVPSAASLPAADAPLTGDPALVMLGSEGWLPNRDAADWFVDGVWPAVRAALPGARLHVFGPLRRGGAGLEPHPPPDESRDAFAPGAVLVVPLRIASGVRMKILEAWARGVPVVATPAAAGGLDAEDGRELLVARDAEGFADACRRLRREPGLASSLIDAGRRRLAERHDPARVTAQLVEVYREAGAR
jgi:hypothetical protein